MKHRVPLRSRVAVLVGTLVLLAGTAGVTAVDASAAGASITVSGSVSSSSAVVGITTACTPTPTQPGHYTAFEYELTSGDASTMTATVTPNGFRGVLSMYQGAFFPDNPVVNCWAAAVGSGSGSTVTLSAPAPDVTAFGQTSSYWTLVVSGYDPSQVGSFTGSISSSNTGIRDTTPAADTTPPVITVPSPITAEATSRNGAAVAYSASANDDVDGPVTPTCTPGSGATFPLGTTTVTCTATDAAGNTATKTFTVTVRDTTPPTITGQPPGGTYSLEATGASGATLSTLGLGVADAVDPSPTLTCTPALPQTFSIGTHPGAISCTARDASGNTTTASFGVTVSDTSAPTITVPADITAEAAGASGTVVTYAASANDAVDGAITPSCTPASGSVFAIGATAVTCAAQDRAGNRATKTFTVTVRDTTAPVVTVPGTLSVEATGPAGATVSFTATATDTVDGALPATCTPASGSTFPLGSTTVTCTATDASGNTGRASFAVVVGDSTAPVLTLPGPIQAEATRPSGAAVAFTAKATDAVDGATPVTCTVGGAPVTSGATFVLGVTTVRCTATDNHGNTASGSFTVTVVDTTAPVVTVPSSVVAEATGPAGASVTFAASATDLVDGAVSVSCTSTSGETFPLGATTVTCSAVDAHGNTGKASFVVLVRDTTAPVVTVPADFAVEATGPAGAPVTFTTSASDLVDGAVATSCSVNSGSTLSLGAHTVECTATDSHGNTGRASFVVTVQDTTAPAILVPTSFSVEATGPAGAAVTFTTSASDVVDGPVPVVCKESTTPVASGDTLGLGSHALTCTATDAHGNTGTAGFTVTVVDTTPPTVTVPQDFSVQATGPGGAPVSFTASASDLVDGSVPTTCTVTSGATLSIGSHVVDCTATDSRGNVGQASFTVTVQDTDAPVVTVPADITAEATGPDGAAVAFTSSATDTVDGARPTTCTRGGEPVASGATFALGVTTVTCTATDTASNTGTATFTVTVRDTTPPVLTVQDVTAEATGPNGAAVTFGATATDAVTASPTVTCLAGTEKVTSGDLFPLGDTTVDCTATDAAGNATTKSFVVSVVDTTGPVITVPGTLTVGATSPAGATVTYTATARDAVRGEVPVQCSPSSGAVFAVGTTTVTCTATDAAAPALRTALAAAVPAAAGTTTQATFEVVVTPYSAGGASGGGSNSGASGSGAGTASSSGRGVLASTGGDVAGLLGVAALLILAGAVVTRTAARRRRS